MLGSRRPGGKRWKPTAAWLLSECVEHDQMPLAANHVQRRGQRAGLLRRSGFHHQCSRRTTHLKVVLVPGGSR